MQAQSGVQQPVSLSEQTPQGQPPPQQGQAVSAAAEGSSTVAVRVAQGKWQVSLCDLCAGGCGPFCLGFCCCGCALAAARSNMDGSNCCFNYCCSGPISTRNLVREGYNIEGNCCCDIITLYFCATCAACQSYNESMKRGLANRVWGENRSTTEVPWNNGLFNIFESMGVCCLGLFCAHCTLAYARSQFDDSNCLFNFFCIGPCLTRSIVREGYNIKGNCWGDIFAPICYPCTACQIMNEVKSRGNVHQTVVSVVQPETMSR